VAGDGGKVMARKSDPLSDSFGTDDSEGWLGGLVADEDDLDRHTMWRLGLWGVAAVGALTLGILSGQLPVNAQRTQLAANDFAGRARHVETSIHENQLEARRLSAAIETLNADRDRLFSRLSALEQGLDLVTGSIRRADDKSAATTWPDGVTAPIINRVPFTIAAPPSAPPATATIAAHTPVEPERTPPPQPVRAAEPSPVENSAPEPVPAAPPPIIQAMPIPDPQSPIEETEKVAADETPVALADFGVDLGAANSISGLRALWRGLAKAHKAHLEGLRPLLAVHERRNGLGLQLRLVAGPIKDAAAAARICAALGEAARDCKTTAFDGQRLSVAAEPEENAAPTRPAKKPRKPTQAPAQPQQSDADKARAAAVATMLSVR
jgi:hypothetical protein